MANGKRRGKRGPQNVDPRPATEDRGFELMVERGQRPSLFTRHGRAAFWLAVGAIILSPTIARGQDRRATNGPPVVALPLSEDEQIDLDGRIDEAVWSRATPITDFTQQEPVEGGRPSRETEVRVVFDSNNLYIVAIIYDDPDLILAQQRARDAFLFTDDKFAWVLDTFRDGRTGYYFETNAAGVLSDGLLTGSSGGFGRGGGGGGFGGVNRSWDGIWEVRTTRRPDGWSAEIRIPFRTLNFDPNSDTWGINFQRSIRRNNEEILWRGFRRNEGLNRLVFAGDLIGLENLSQGIGLEAVASAVANWRNVPADDDPTTFPSNVSLDVNYSVTPSLRASFSVNTDFAEVESDQRRVNLTRFPLFFPERRDFFLEGSSVFTFAPRSGPQPFFSRRIGIVGGEQVPIDYGVRLTGQVRGVDVGFYQMATGSHAFVEDDDEGNPVDARLESEAFTVGRLRFPMFEQSSIGAIYTRRGTSADSTGFAPADRHTSAPISTCGRETSSAATIWSSRPSGPGTRTPSRRRSARFRTSRPGALESAFRTTSGPGTCPIASSATTTTRPSGS